jgi:ADP-L-glycero-D-manno-heptose 6-epimerase
MASVLAKVVIAPNPASRSVCSPYREGIADGDQRRDFITSMMRFGAGWLLEATGINGIFNVGIGKAESFRDMISAMFKALHLPTNIEYIDMPEAIRGQYQYFTEARIERLRGAGYNAGFMPLEAAVHRYVTGYLNCDDRYR